MISRLHATKTNTLMKGRQVLFFGLPSFSCFWIGRTRSWHQISARRLNARRQLARVSNLLGTIFFRYEQNSRRHCSWGTFSSANWAEIPCLRSGEILCHDHFVEYFLGFNGNETKGNTKRFKTYLDNPKPWVKQESCQSRKEYWPC